MTKPISNFNKPLKTSKPLTNLWIAENFSTYPLLETEENEPAEIDEKPIKESQLPEILILELFTKNGKEFPSVSIY